MSKSKKAIIDVQGTEITVLSVGDEDYISLTDMAQKFGDDNLIYSWMRNRNTLEFLGIWEQLHNPDFNSNEFVTFKTQAGLNSFNLTPRKWISATGAIGIRSRAGRYDSGTFAHRDLAFEFGSWLSPEFKLYLIKEFQRLKQDESRRLAQGEEWNLNRTLSKINYHIHTDAIQNFIVPQAITASQVAAVYATEADLLNMALFGQTAQQWRGANPQLKGNMRDYATIEQLLVMANLESINAELIRMGLPQNERVKQLNQSAITQLKTLTAAAQKLQQRAEAKKPKGELE